MATPDSTGLQTATCPPRWKEYADYMNASNPGDYASLNPDDQTFYTTVRTTIGAFGSPVPYAGVTAVVSGTSIGLLVDNTSYQNTDPIEAVPLNYGSTPITWTYSLGTIAAWSAAGPAQASSTATGLTVTTGGFVSPTMGTASIASGLGSLTAGTTVFVAIQGAAVGGTKGQIVQIQATVPPANASSVTYTGAAGQITFAFTVATGSQYYNLYASLTGGQNAAQIRANANVIKVDGFLYNIIAGPNYILKAAVFPALVAGTYSCTMTSVNPGGESAGFAAGNATVS